MKVSIVINTLNRGFYLKKLLYALQKQTFREFEVVVVNGPSTDDTESVLKMFETAIKVETCPVTNLSVSRNIGIKASAGDIVAFIDDDAIPNNQWLADIVSYYTDISIGGVGGKVFDAEGKNLQFCNGYIDIWGAPVSIIPASKNYNDANAPFFNIIPGGNCSFKKSVLLEVGGFDEYYEYYHDESDLAVRIIKAGYKILHHPDACIYHASAKSSIRSSPYLLNWYPIVKNATYFGLKNSEGYCSLEERKTCVQEVAQRRLDEFKDWYKNGYIEKQDYELFKKMWSDGYKQGLEDGFNTERRINFEIADKYIAFKKYMNIKKDRSLEICLICADDPVSSKSGVAKYTMDLAESLAAAGNSVHIITKDDKYVLALNRGIMIHYVTPESIGFGDLKDYPICEKNLEYSYGAYKKIKAIISIYGVDIIESPLWDYEGIVCAELLSVPLVTRLETPLIMAANIYGWNINEDLELHIDFEKSLVSKSAGVIYISDDIKQTFEHLYGYKINNRLKKVYLGINPATDVQSVGKKDKNKVVVFFVGRLERRKGIQNLLEGIPYILENSPNVEFRIAGRDDMIDEQLGNTFKNAFLKTHKRKKWIKRVIFLGEISNEQKEDEFASCDIFTSPSLYESFGIIFIEAMRYKKPVIGCRVGGMQEVIEEGKTGLLVEPGNTEQLKGALIELINSPKERTEYGNNGFARLNELFTSERMCNETLDFYKEVIKDQNDKKQQY